MTVYVSVGPSLPLEEARREIDATFVPPVAMGDVYSLSRKRPRAIVIIDGLFEQTPSVWHKEILHAMESGVAVYGAASMGALRAAELHTFGMIGVGTIFEWFRSGELEDDDEVTVVHAPAEHGYRPLSDAMVNVRHGLRLAEAQGVVSGAAASLIRDEAKALFYADRSWEAACANAVQRGVAPHEAKALLSFVREHRPNLKKEDALSALRLVAASIEKGLQRRPASFTMERTSFWLQLVESTARAGQQDATGEDLRNHARLQRGFAERRRGALLLHFARQEARRLGIELTKAELQAAGDRLRGERGLLSAKATSEWLEASGVTVAELKELAELEALLRKLLVYYADPIESLLLTELLRKDELAELRRTVRDKRALLERRGVANPTVEDTGADLAAVLRWHWERTGEPAGDLEAHARSLGFESSRGFLAELLGQYIHEHGSRTESGGDHEGS